MLVYDNMDFYVNHIREHLDDWKTKTTEDNLSEGERRNLKHSVAYLSSSSVK